MSLFKPNAPSSAEQQAEALATKVANLRTTSLHTFRVLLGNVTAGLNAVWDDPNPSEILKLIGTDAGELFFATGKSLELLETLQPGCTEEVVKKIQPTTTNKDGTVTLA